MARVDIRWRPSGGRGEYEHVPSDVLMGRRILIKPVSVSGLIQTDVRGEQKDGKPRLRRDDPNDRKLLNVHALIAALALFPDPMREDKGQVVLPLRDKGYVLASLTCDVEYADNGDAVCTPLRMQVLHDTTIIDLFGRLSAVGMLLERADLPPKAALAAKRYRALIATGAPLAELREVADELRSWLDVSPHAAEQLDQPSADLAPEPPLSEGDKIASDELSVDETKRRLVSHYKIDRDQGIKKSKIAQFKALNGGKLVCEACSFSFEERYGEYAKDVIDVHHTRPLGTLLPNTMTKLSDLMLLCSNCHRVVHRRKKPLTPDELIGLLKSHGST
jgi:hypothetical protein